MKEHPITPPPELLKQWVHEFYGGTPISPGEASVYIATQAARWGADQELEACCEWFIRDWTDIETAMKLRAARRPRTLSLKEQALKELKDWTDEKHGPGGEVFLCEGLSVALIREALESLPD